MVEPYAPQVAPGRATATLPSASPDVFGAGVGASLASAGGELAQRQLRQLDQERRQEQDRQLAQGMADWATASAELDIAENEARQNALPGAAGHAHDAIVRFDARSRQVLESVTDDEVRQRLSVTIAQARGRVHTEADAWQRGRAVALTVQNVATATETFANTVGRGASAESLGGTLGAIDTMVDGLTVLDGTHREQLRRDARQAVTTSWLSGRAPEEALAMLDSGAFDGELTPAQIERVRNNAEVELRRRQVAAEAEARAQAADAREQVAAIMREVADGVPIAEDRLAAAAELAASAGLSGDSYDIAKARVRSRLNREYQSATPIQIEQAVRNLDVRIAQAGDDAGPGLIVARDHLQQLLDRRRQDVDDNPAGFAATVGIDYGVLDPANPETVSARYRAARATAAATGRPAAYLTPEETSQLRSGMTSRDGRIAALQVAHAFARTDPSAVRSAAREIAPDDRLFQHAARLGPSVGAAVLEGRELIRGRSFAPPRDLGDFIARRGGVALRQASPQLRADIVAAAQALYAVAIDADGNADPAVVDENVVSRAIRRASGGTVRNGEWVGGIGNYNGQAVTLPDGTTVQPRPWDDTPTPIQQALARGHRWLEMLQSGKAQSLTEVAELEGMDRAYVSRMVNLTTLAPDIVAAILDETLPDHVTLFDLASGTPLLWDDQRALLRKKQS